MVALSTKAVKSQSPLGDWSFKLRIYSDSEPEAKNHTVWKAKLLHCIIRCNGNSMECNLANKLEAVETKQQRRDRPILKEVKSRFVIR